MSLSAMRKPSTAISLPPRRRPRLQPVGIVASGRPFGRRNFRNAAGSVAGVEHCRHQGLTFDVWDLGPPDGEVVVLLHGFPQTKAAWSEVAPPLADAGYRVVAPDQRGYSPSARPVGRRQYTLDLLAGDVLALADAAGASRFHVVGHDWGGAVAWALAMWHPERLHTMTSLTVPHPRAYLRAMLTSRQLFLSWYALFFQLPRLPEWSARFAPSRRLFERALERSGLPDKHREEYRAALDDPSATTATINWYRAGPLVSPSRFGPVTVPTLYVYAADDVALGRRAADLTARYVTGRYRYEVLQGTSHWIPEVAPEVVVRLLLEHLSEPA
jgi:pimeloyl-ACP methyl ester carboxylesterase